ncbi:Crp/Fnr family transcriptional regulator [Sphingomonas sabuli]|uniref:Crp/Fnr family transcriptional regulator n=1 Tax=Sphingomonas sabuli TaxID=2764186 RepID=A0A7G9L2E7_9SPHN|nr:Crp/Fnr family transcriptional regulator [Sphingomonas sabuli]QNM82796.1 Crp/Fnr family transcriptional regulator [Sphingomonas sabuli]
MGLLSVRNRFIEKLRNFATLSDPAEAALEAATRNASKLPARRDLIREGDRPGPVFVVLDGWACRYKILPNGGRQILAYLMPGDCCDLHIGLLAEMDHGIQTITPAQVATISGGEMDSLLTDHRGFARAMYITQLVDEGTMRAWITSMGRRTSKERASHLLCELYLRARNIGLTDGIELVLPLSQIMLADSLGMTPVHLNRVLKELRLSGTIQLRRGSVAIVDPARLAQIAGFDENYLHRRLRPAIAG